MRREKIVIPYYLFLRIDTTSSDEFCLCILTVVHQRVVEGSFLLKTGKEITVQMAHSFLYVDLCGGRGKCSCKVQSAA